MQQQQQQQQQHINLCASAAKDRTLCASFEQTFGSNVFAYEGLLKAEGVILGGLLTNY